MAEESKKPTKTKKPTAQKRDIQNKKRNLLNSAFKSRVRTTIKGLQKGISEKESSDQLQLKLKTLYSLMDKGVKKGIYKPNKAARTKATYSERTKA